MRQRQPHGANLLPARRDAVDDAPRDDEMASRVVVAERQTELVIAKSGSHAEGRGQRTGEDLHDDARNVSSVCMTVGHRYC